MCESLTPHKNQSRNIISRVVPKSHNSVRALNSNINIKIDSSCCLNRLKNLCHCTIFDSLGLWCYLIAYTKSVYDLSWNLSGAAKLHISSYAFGLMTVRRITLFLFMSLTPLVVEKMLNHSE